MFTITFFLILGAAILVLLLGSCISPQHSQDYLSNSKSFRWVYLGLLALLGIFSLATVKNYMYPSDTAIFSNADYHVIEHKGFQADKSLYLARGQYPDNYFPETSLWDSKSGLVRIDSSSIDIVDFSEPFFLEERTGEGSAFVLENNIIKTDISKDGLTITKETGGKKETLYHLSIVEDRKDKKHVKVYYVSSSEANSPDTSKFDRPIKAGYPLSEIIAQSPRFVFSEELQDLLDGALLVRERIPIVNAFGAESSKENKSALLLFPGYNLYTAYGVNVNDAEIEHPAFHVPYSGTPLLYSGIGRTKTDIYKLSYDTENNAVQLKYVLPKMHKLRQGANWMFITSSISSVLDDSKDGGYYYGVFDNENNVSHIEATIRYDAGASTESMVFEVMDANSVAPGAKKTIVANQDFVLSPYDKKDGGLEWVFDINDLRATNGLQFLHFLVFIFAFIMLVGVRLLVDSLWHQRTLSFVELAAYVIVLCLCVVRLIIGWRSSTFVPVEDITASVFSKMRNGLGIWYYTSLVCILPLAMTISAPCIKWQDNRFGTFKQMMSSCPVWVILAANILLLGACFVLAKGQLERLLNIPVPLLMYLDFDRLLKKHRNEDERGSTTGRIILVLVTFGYLFLKDAGFSIIFFVYLFLYHVVLSPLMNGRLLTALLGESYFKRSSWSDSNNRIAYAISAVGIILLVLFFKFEGALMIWAFNNVGIILLIGAATFIALLSMRLKSEGKALKIVYGALTAILLVGGVIEILPGSSHKISDTLNERGHIKYRAEVQKLQEGQTVDDLVVKYDFKSSDITYIMRSAHNQWFINQYLKAGENQTRHFTVQPHSNQGSTYTTQTTDLVVTRYLLAEHGRFVVPLFLLMFFMLVLIFCYEVLLNNADRKSALGALVLLFSIALMVYLSATNRIVFIGQDFPFISIQSLVAIVFPLILLFVTAYSVTKDKLTPEEEGESEETYGRKWAVPVALFLTATLSVFVIKPQGKNQTESQFDISEAIEQLSAKVEVLDRSLLRYQYVTRQKDKRRDDVWQAFLEDKAHSHIWYEALNDNSEDNQFYRSLLDYFNTRQAIKNNPEELLHLRKRNGYWRLALNKSYFFIPSMMDNLQWRGEVLAAQTKHDFYFKNLRSRNRSSVNNDDSYDSNILPGSVIKDFYGARIARFDESWTNTGEPLVILNANQSLQTKQYFNIESEEGLIKGTPGDHQLAMQVRKGDYVSLNTPNELGDEKELIFWQYGKDNENYLAKNIWMNGRQRLFYPLGKESMWSYQFANVVSNVFGENEAYRDSSMRVSIDYSLQKLFYEYMDTVNVQKLSMSASTIKQLHAFQELPESEMANEKNNTPFYYDRQTKKVLYKKGSSKEIINVTRRVNAEIEFGDKDIDAQARIISAIDMVMERKFDFSAVVLDGNGRIRLLFDHTRKRNNVDPNNIRFYNKFVSDLYLSGSNQSERDIFGNKALQIIPSGPGSTFKPIAYTAITSQQKIAWDQLDVLSNYMYPVEDGGAYINKIEDVRIYRYYGGLDLTEKKLGSLAIAGDENSLLHDNFLTHSNNLYHSTIILIGMQRIGEAEKVFRPARGNVTDFPVISYKKKHVTFNPNVWFANNDLNVENGIMNIGLLNNFNLRGDMVRTNERYVNYFGQQNLFKFLFDNAKYRKIWIYPEAGSLNTFDRKQQPILRNGFNQMLTGAYPLEVTPLQMATMGMRLVTLNRAEELTTLDDAKNTSPAYDFFSTPTWEANEYFNFYKTQVFAQLRAVPISGTASSLSKLSTRLEEKGYYMYAKTGTLNDQREGAGKNSRIKHLMVIITNQKLESLNSIKELKNVKYYVIYMSFLGVNKDGFNNSKFEKMIEYVSESELFNSYMNEKVKKEVKEEVKEEM